MTRRLLYGGLATFGLAIYLWPALAAPVVRWSDSELDLAWARRGEGILSPVVSLHHPPKPGYILFLRAAMAAGPVETEARRIVVIQALLLWLSIGISAVLIGRRLGGRWGATLYVLLILFLRLRDSSSAIMSEAVAAALLLPILAVLLDPPERLAPAALLGVAIALLFVVRPNAGAAVFLLGAVALRSSGRRIILGALAGFVALWLPFWAATRVPDDAFRGLSPNFVVGSADYGWMPQHGRAMPEPPPSGQVRRAIEGWRATFREPSTDRSRQLWWRALHGLLGTDFYDARWSPAYARLVTASRVIYPALLLAAIAAFFAAIHRGRAWILGLLLVAILIAQGLLLGALPRYALPFLPALLLFGIVAIAEVGSVWRLLGGLAVFTMLLAAVAWQHQVLDWEWGRIETAGVRIVQTIPPGSLPEREPATLHVRVAPLLVPTGARLEVLGPGGETLWTGPSEEERADPYLTIPLPQPLLSANRNAPIRLTVGSRGSYDDAHFVIFPVIPRPWGSPATRLESEELSPASGIAAGSLDWWVHRGTD